MYKWQEYDLQVEVERNELVVRITNLKEDVRSYEDQVKEQALRLGQSQEEASSNRSNAHQLKWG